MESILALAYSCGNLHAAEVQEVMSLFARLLQVSGSDGGGVDDQQDQGPVRDERIAASTSGMVSPVAARRQPGGRERVEPRVSRSRSLSSMRCCVPTRVARKRPDLIQRRTVSGSRLVRRAASGTVSIVARHYYKSLRFPQSPREKP